MAGSRPEARGVIGRVLLASAAIMTGLAVAFWLGWIPIAPETRPLISVVLIAASVIDTLIGLRFLGESTK